MMESGDLVNLEHNAFFNVSDEQVPVGSTLRFLSGFSIRQEVAGMNGYGYPPECFWTVTLDERNGLAGIVLPKGDEEYRYKVAGEERERVELLHHEPTFIPLSQLRYASSAEVIELPPT